MSGKSANEPVHRWRENLEALTMAIVVALLFKYFILEISKIPSGSMQPTLMGNPETGVFDRTVVDKLSFRFRDPERFEIVVFKHPLERSRIMVKRLVGMPGEQLKIEHGDLWTRKSDDEPWRHPRRSAAVQRGMWRELSSGARGADWSVVRGGKEWQLSGDGIAARGDGAARFREGQGPIRDTYQDGYPGVLVHRIRTPPQASEKNPVGDVRLEGELSALAATSAVSFELTEGRRVYEFTLPGPDAPEESEVRVRIRDSATSTERVERGERFRLAAGARVSFALENLDDRLALEVDGRTLLAAEIEPSERQEASLTLAVAGAGADFSALSVARDIYYLPRDGRSSWKVEIPPGHYVMLGDNAQDSADSRLWDSITLTYADPAAGRAEEGGPATVVVRGNYRERENPVSARLPDGQEATRFRDLWGEIHWIPRVRESSRSFPGNEALVPRELIVGRAWAVFWPIWPFEGLWRVAWLR